MSEFPPHTLMAHELAKILFSIPDMPVIGIGVGQASNETGDEDLFYSVVGDYNGQIVIKLEFGMGKITHPETKWLEGTYSSSE
jgi:hypothetical protein